MALLNTKWRYLVTAVFLLFPVATMSSGDDVSPEYVRAMYIKVIKNFIQVGAAKHEVKRICYYEKEEMTDDKSVGKIVRKLLKDQPDNTIELKGYQDIHDFKGCDILYIPDYEESQIDDVIAALGSQPILTVSPAKRFIYRGGMIGFTVDDSNHVRMEANLKNMYSKEVYPSAQLLEIMQFVAH